MTPRELSKVLAQQAGTVGTVFGREGTGLKNHELSLCDATVTIPASEAYQTLNLSHAASIIFYELFNSESKDGEEWLATEEVRDTIVRYLSDSMTLAGVEDYKRGLTNRAVKNVLGRSAIRRREANLLAGALRRISNAFHESRTSDGSISAGEQSAFR